MDTKTKLEDSYMPDKKSLKEKIILGLSGGLDAYVTAYLLKIQKYELIGVTVVNSWDGYEGDSGQLFSCHLSQNSLDRIKEFCHRLGIPHHTVKAGPMFKEAVIEPWMADKAYGKLPTPCWSCHDMRMKVLFDKMQELGAKHIATGHYAKLFHHETHGSVFVHTSNDEQHDQSALLSRLPREILNGLILPLSDLTKKEVTKLAENFGVIENPKKLEFKQCLSEDLAEQIEKHVPKRFIKEGEIVSDDNLQGFGDHEGIHHFTYGQLMEFRDAGHSKKYRLGGYFYPQKKITVMEEEFFLRKKIMLTDCYFSEEVSWVEPLKGVLSKKNDQYFECWVQLKNLSTVSIEFFEEKNLLEGEIVSVIKKKGKNAKVFLTGKVRFLPIEDNADEEGESGASKVNYSIDF
ncbi:MAG: hypothetical protein NDI69_18060 [Bacteriovoracaceae bacterium]|nr:hypothetical protein [Bacteriovoracaceae bacterium]